LKGGNAVVRWCEKEDERAQALRDLGAGSWSVICSPISIRCIGRLPARRCTSACRFQDAYLAAAVNAAAVAITPAFINMSQMTVSNEHYRNDRESAAQVDGFQNRRLTGPVYR
jgi:hypothetical protein